MPSNTHTSFTLNAKNSILYNFFLSIFFLTAILSIDYYNIIIYFIYTYIYLYIWDFENSEYLNIEYLFLPEKYPSINIPK